MSIMELGALGEFVGSIGVIATLIYLALQIRQNTRSMDEGRRLAIAQAYQSRSEQLEASFRENAHSDHIPALMTKLEEQGLDALDAEERYRYRASANAFLYRLDNLHMQHELGFMTDEYFEQAFVRQVRRIVPQLKEIGIDIGTRPSFLEDVEQILADEP